MKFCSVHCSVLPLEACRVLPLLMRCLLSRWFLLVDAENQLIFQGKAFLQGFHQCTDALG